MQKSKLVKLLEALPLVELNEFGRYIRTDFFNRKDKLKELTGFLIDCMKEKRSWKTKDQLYLRLFPEEEAAFAKMKDDRQAKHARKRMDTLVYELKNHLENYLVWKQSQEPGYFRNLDLLKALQARSANDFYFDLSRRMVAELQDKSALSVTNHIHLHQLVDMTADFYDPGEWPEVVQSLPLLQGELDIYFLIHKLRNNWIHLINEHFSKGGREVAMVEEVLAMAENPAFKKHLFVDVHAQVTKDFLNNDFSRKSYQYLKKRIFQELDDYCSLDQLKLFILLLNYSVLMNHYCSDSTPKDYFDLHLLGIERGYFIQNKLMTYSNFHNCVLSAVGNREMEWAKNFVETHAQFLEPSIRVPVVQLELALIRHQSGDFQGCLAMLDEKEVFISAIDKVQVILLRIKCQYALEYVEVLENTLEAARKMLERSGALRKEFKVRSLNFIRLASQLHRARWSPKRAVLVERIGRELQEIGNCMAREWLTEKIAELKSLG